MPKSILDPSRSLAAILAGLRLLQAAIGRPEGDLDDGLEDILTDGGTLPVPTHQEINELCEYVNSQEGGTN